MAVFQDEPHRLRDGAARRGDGALGARDATRPRSRDVLLSGWMRGAETPRAHAPPRWRITYGKGKVVLLGFRPQHRAQTPATFPFLFNALYWSTAR